jgi:hypothetical protein
MFQPLFPLAMINQLWYALPLIVAISLVYAATRHELPGPIMAHAARLGIWITGFMGVVLGVLAFISWQL